MGRIGHQIAQSTLEFTFAMIVIIFLIYGMVHTFRWAGMEMATRRVAHDDQLTNMYLNAEQQLTPEFDRVQHLDAVYHGNIVR